MMKGGVNESRIEGSDCRPYLLAAVRCKVMVQHRPMDTFHFSAKQAQRLIVQGNKKV